MSSQPTHNYNWVSGNTEEMDLRLLSEELVAQDLTGSTAELGIKVKVSDISYAYSDEVELVAETTNEFLFVIESTTTESLLPVDKQRATYVYAVDVKDSNNNITTVLTGRITVTRNALS